MSEIIKNGTNNESISPADQESFDLLIQDLDEFVASGYEESPGNKKSKTTHQIGSTAMGMGFEGEHEAFETTEWRSPKPFKENKVSVSRHRQHEDNDESNPRISTGHRHDIELDSDIDRLIQELDVLDDEDMRFPEIQEDEDMLNPKRLDVEIGEPGDWDPH
ncbi:MAG: hypothetical protein WCG30_03100 [Candidatus Saccharibacteria bacterium]